MTTVIDKKITGTAVKKDEALASEVPSTKQTLHENTPHPDLCRMVSHLTGAAMT